MNLNLFQITRRSERNNTSLKLNFECKRGTAIQVNGTYPGYGDKAEVAGVFMGFTSRDVKIGGPSLGDVVFPGRLELPEAVGEEVSLEFADAGESEGVEYLLTSGTGALSGSTAVGTKLAFKDGRLYAAQTNDIVRFQVTDNSGLTNTQLTPAVAGNLRIAWERI